MASLILVSAVVLLSGLGRGAKFGAVVDVVMHTDVTEFDFFKLSLYWPATFCATNEKKCCPQNACCKGSNTTPPGFTIHGLWPHYNNGSWPSCCEGPAYDESKISSLFGAMQAFSPVLSCDYKSTCDTKMTPHWDHQWETHGTCATSVTGDQYEYFLTTLTLYLKYNVTDVLSEAGYVPSNAAKYSSAGIISAIENAFHAPPQLICREEFIKEVHLCFTKNFKIRECVGPGDCPIYVTLPEFAFIDSTENGDWLKSAINSVV